MGLVKTAMAGRGVTSFDQLAAQMLEEADWSASTRGTPLKVRSLGAKIGDLDRGKPGWWHKRPRAVERLAEVLDVEKEDVVPAAPPIDGPGLLFSRFPQLRPFDPHRERPLPIGTLVHLTSDGEDRDVDPFDWFRAPGGARPRRTTWAQLPPGTGRSLLLHRCRQLGHVEVVEALNPTEALGQLDVDSYLPVLVSIQEPDVGRGLLSLQKLAERHGMLVVSAWRPPQHGGFAQRWQEAAQWPGGTSESPRTDGWPGPLVVWKPRAGWRADLLQWVFSRAPTDSLLDPTALAEWLERTDPGEQVFQTPGDIVTLAAMAHRHGERRLTARLTWTERLGDYLETSTDEMGDDARDRLIAHGPTLIRAMALRHLDECQLPWEDGCSGEEWVSLVPHELEVAGHDALVLDAASMVQRLRRARVLRSSTPNRSVLEPRWAIRGLVLEEVERRVRTCDSAAFAAAIEPQRRILFAAALERLDMVRLAALAASLIGEPVSLGRRAAIELLFHIVAGRLAEGYPAEVAPALEALAAARLAASTTAAVVSDDSDSSSHPGCGTVVLEGQPGATPDDCVADVLTWSLCVDWPDGPATPPASAIGWHEEGSIEPLSLPVTRGPRKTKSARFSTGEPAPQTAFLRLLAIAPRALQHMGLHGVGLTSREWLIPAALVRALDDESALDVSPVSAVSDRLWFRAAVAEISASSSSDTRRRVAARLWRAYTGELTRPDRDSGDSSRHVFLRLRPLASWTLTHLAVDDFVASLDRDGAQLPCAVASLRPALRSAYAHWALANQNVAAIRQYIRMASSAEPDDLDALEAVAAFVRGEPLLQRARWRLNEEVLHQQLVSYLHGALNLAPVAWSAPSRAVRRVLKDALVRPESTPPAVWSWLRTRLVDCGADAPLVWARAVTGDVTGTGDAQEPL